ncbi:helix-turn-helix domain-containing protein [Streptomyces sp. NPDC087425]|uniref:helix-turn-helix domain-containing protein n=1 Tax=Streptomyces sp. NPDC087425 TaxID=3365787 RepID=UPI003820644A
MDTPFPSQDHLLGRGPRPQLPPPAERRQRRELWGATLEEVASALNVKPKTMAAWEAGQHHADTADTYAYLCLLNAFRDQLPTAYEPDWSALRTPPVPSARPSTAPIPEQATGERPTAKPARRGAPWAQEEKDRARDAFLGGTTIEEIAESLERSEKSVRWVLYHLRLIPFPADDVPAPRAKPEKPKAYTVEEKRKIHPNAYAPWSADDERNLAERCAQGASLAELSQEFGRNPGGIASRLIKINADGPAVEEAYEYGGDVPGAAL